MNNSDIYIRDPFILKHNDKYFLYGTRASDFGIKTGGFDVYSGDDLENWSEPKEIFNSGAAGLNTSCNWAPEVHEYKGRYYIFATFTQTSGNRGTYSLVSDKPDGPFVKCSCGALTPQEWMSLDGTLYIDNASQPYLVFCHEHVQILNGTVCYVRLSDDLSKPIGECKYMFSGSEAYGASAEGDGRYVTDGPFMYRGRHGRLYMIWSTIIGGSYYQCIAASDNGEIDGKWTQLPPVFADNGGHGMIFKSLEGKLMLTLHRPNRQPDERPCFLEIEDTGETLKLKNLKEEK